MRLAVKTACLWLAILLSIALTTATASAKRVALVIGNSAYEHVTELANPKNDAEAVAASLQSLGFEVVSGFDLDRIGLEQAVREFSKVSRGAKLTLFYYAGHGLQVGGQNYLIPVDAELADEADLDFQTVSMNAVLRSMERERRTNLIILDACRDNPLAKNLARSMGTRSSSVGRGLAPLETGVGTLISFSTQPGNVALDGDGANSPFTTALLRHMNAPKLDVAIMMRRVRRDVMDATGGRQVPWSNSSLTDAVYLSDDTGGNVEQPAEVDSALAAWNAIRESDSPAMFETFISRYPDSLYADFARARLDEISKQTAALDRGTEGFDGNIEIHGDPPSSSSQDCVKLDGGVLLCTSSVLDPQGRNSYHTGNLVDGNQSTAWVEGIRGDGIGEWILVDFGELASPGMIELRNGYTKNNDIYRKNGRVREIEIVTSAGETRTASLSDNGSFQAVDLSGFTKMRWLQLRILSVYRGSKYRDTAISELRVLN